MTTRLCALMLAAATIGLAVPAQADDTGLSVLHELRREGGRTCFLDHYHYGSSAGLPNRKHAEKEALVSWASFVDLEYGSDWAKPLRAASRKLACEQAAGGWGCSFEARPCR